jgi:hypothetical protein
MDRGYRDQDPGVPLRGSGCHQVRVHAGISDPQHADLLAEHGIGSPPHLLEDLARLTTDHPTDLRQLNELTNYAGRCASATTRASRIPTSLSASRPPRYQARRLHQRCNALVASKQAGSGVTTPGEPQRRQR